MSTSVTQCYSFPHSFVPSNQKRFPDKSFPPILSLASSQATELPLCLQWPGHASFGVGIILLFLSVCRCHSNWPLHSGCHRNSCSSIPFVQVMEMMRDMESQSIARQPPSWCYRDCSCILQGKVFDYGNIFNKIKIFIFFSDIL